MLRHPRHIIAGPSLGAAGGDDAAAFRFDEFDAAGIGKTLFGRIDDLDQRAVRARRRQSRQRRSDLADRRPEVRQHDDFGQCRRHKGRRQAEARGVVMQHRLRHLVDHAAARGRIHQARHANAFAARDQEFREREGHDQRAFQLAVARLFGGKRHRRRTVRPQPHRVRGLPFLLADIEMIVARRAPPVDVLRGLAGHEAAVLPETFA